jgi:hypothetical protein
MYYGISGGANVYIGCEMEHGYIDVDSFMTPIAPMSWNNHWTLTTQFDGIEAEVRATSTKNADRRVVISTLLAGLKVIQDSAIYDASVASIETKLGFQVDEWISSEIAFITSTSFNLDTQGYEIQIQKVIGNSTLHEPNLQLDHLIDQHLMQVSMRVKIGGSEHKCALTFDEYLWWDNEHECMEYARVELVRSLYKQFPELTPDFSVMRYYLFEDSMKEVSDKSKSVVMTEQLKYQPVNKWGETVKSKPFTNPAADVYHDNGEDNRVDELPALNEMVIHPVMKQKMALKRVIISLNDGQKWTREQIADWLETLDIDISFKVDNEQD